jgi:putative ABC transport system permease protein
MQSDVIDPMAHIKLIVSGDETEQKNIENNLDLILEQYPGFKLRTIQEAMASQNDSIREVSAAIIGITLFLILFSIITFISTIITNLAIRKQEFAMLQSIGMEREQIIKMAIFESSLLAFGSLLITLIFGTILGRIMVSILKNIGVFYLSYSFPFAIFGLYVITIIMIIAAITFFTFRVFQKDTLVERLRMID